MLLAELRTASNSIKFVFKVCESPPPQSLKQVLFHLTPSSTQLHTLPWLPLGLNTDHELTPHNYTL